ncbi:MAG: hypothetical protein C5B51_04445 [Terriglobia bacterium]|nr:MAG: hypothetical protein C5B51_04445 [Terriglobia bacterium]
MRLVLVLAFLTSLSAAPLELVRPIISDSEDGAALPSGFEHRPGETLFFSCRVAGYQKGPDEKIRLAYSVQAFDSKGVALDELFKNEISDEITPQDKEWMPKIRTEIPVPPLIAPGAYRIEVHAEDLVAKTKTDLTVPFEVRGHEVAPSDTLVVRNSRFYRGEEDTQALERPVYRAGDAVWLKFDITGFRYGPKNKIDVNYVSSILDSSGKVLWTQPEPTSEQTESFYPKLYVPAVFSITVQPNTRPGPYTIAAQVKDSLGNQTYEAKATFTVE